MELSRQQRRQLQDALIAAFPSKPSLEQMLSHQLDKNLDAIADGGNLQEIVFNLIKTVESQGWIEKLVCAARKENPGNSKLKAIVPHFSDRTISKVLAQNQQVFITGIVTQTYSESGITGQGGGNAGTIDLTSHGVLDWVQFATGNRKSGSTLISNAFASAPTTKYTNELFRTTWSDGIPSGLGSVTEGLALGILNGQFNDPYFEFTVQSSTTQKRRLTLIVGNYNSTCTLTATLPGAASYTDTFSNLNQAKNYSSRVYVIDFQAKSLSDVLTIRLRRNGFGNHMNADLIAAALSPAPADR